HRPPTSSPSFLSTTTATTQLYTLSLHDALPIFARRLSPPGAGRTFVGGDPEHRQPGVSLVRRGLECARSAPPLDAFRAEHLTSLDRKSTRLNSSHVSISYAVFCLKKKKNKKIQS